MLTLASTVTLPRDGLMLISHRYRFIFLRTEKTGSTSVFHALRELCGNSVATLAAGVPEPTDVVRGKGGVFRHYLPTMFGLWYHANAQQVQSVLGEERFASYFKFSIERNPWDRQVSLYSHRHKKRGIRDLSNFARNMRNPLWRALHHSRVSNWDIYSIKGKPCYDYMIKYEQLNEGFNEVLRRIGAEGKVTLAHRNSSERKDGGDYRAAYTPQTQALVAKWHAREIKEFGYSF